jgi:hypothetical protein
VGAWVPDGLPGRGPAGGEREGPAAKRFGQENGDWVGEGGIWVGPD